MKAIASFNSKLFKPCKRLLRLLKLPYKRPISIIAFRFRNLSKFGSKKRRPRKRRLGRYLRSVFGRSSEEMDGMGEMKSMMTERDWVAPFPSPLTPAYVKLAAARLRGMEEEEAAVGGGDDVEESCRSFENYLVEMIVEEGKVRDLMDVEELLYCWNGLKSPVFVDLVCRFYGELCNDLFSGRESEDEVVDDDSV